MLGKEARLFDLLSSLNELRGFDVNCPRIRDLPSSVRLSIPLVPVVPQEVKSEVSIAKSGIVPISTVESVSKLAPWPWRWLRRTMKQLLYLEDDISNSSVDKQRY